MPGKKTIGKTLAMLAGPIAAAAIWFALTAGGLKPAACWTAAITTWCMVWWIFEPLPVEATSIIPFAVFPIVGVLDSRQVAAGYGHEMVLLFVGGFMISQGLGKSGAHKRLAIGMVHLVGGLGGRRLVLGFMLAAVLVSMWVSTTATTLMFLPMMLAVLEQMDEKERKIVAVPLLLSLVLGVNIGAMGTCVSTPPNIICVGVYKDITGNGFSLVKWMKVALPIVIILVPFTWFWLTRNMGRSQPVKLPILGAWRTEEKRIIAVFLITVAGWIFLEGPFGGWQRLIGVKGVGNSTVALLSVMIMFLCPNGHGGRLLDWKTASNIPWGLLLMVGGSMTIGAAFDNSGLSKVIGDKLAGSSSLPLFAIIGIVSVGAGIMTNMMNHTAMAALLMPLLGAAGKATGIDPIFFMMPAAIGIDTAFTTPISTMSNLIIYGTGYVPVRTMVKEGFIPNLVGIILVAIMCYMLLPR
jgi:sodium-dependent dicarboxylate transporter 2/3/5